MMAARLFLLALLVGSFCAFAAVAAKTSRAGTPIVCSTVNQHIPDPGYCEGYYLCDFNLEPERVHCASGLFFNPTTDVCDIPFTSHCNAGTCTATRPLPDKVNCNAYYECPEDVLVHGVCDDGYYFEYTAGGCIASPVPCYGECLFATTLIPDPYDCNSYWDCVFAGNFNPVLTPCPAGHKFDATTGTCVYDPTFC